MASSLAHAWMRSSRGPSSMMRSLGSVPLQRMRTRSVARRAACATFAVELSEAAHLLERAARGEGHVLEHLRHALHRALGELAQRLSGPQHQREHLERGEDPVARRRVVEEDEVPGLLAAEVVAAARASPRRRTGRPPACARASPRCRESERSRPEVAHDGGDDGLLPQACPRDIMRAAHIASI